MQTSSYISGFRATAPSNIAFIKYWGKKTGQIPLNPSLSMTLTKASTCSELSFFHGELEESQLFFEGKTHLLFENKFKNYLRELASLYPVLNSIKILVKTKNSFPHSAGIASSASSYASFAIVIHRFLKETFQRGLENASSLARRGSGSACRSLVGPFALWGHTESADNSSMAHAIKIDQGELEELADTIVMVESAPKQVSSRQGHQLMEHHPYREVRVQQAEKRTSLALDYLKKGDFAKLGEIIEQEALELHALMMTSSQPYWLMASKTLELMNFVKLLRARGLPVFFTLDAGPNLHLISYKRDQPQLVNELKNIFAGTAYLEDCQLSPQSYLSYKLEKL